MVYPVFLRHGDSSHDTTAEHDPREEQLPLQGWCESLSTSKCGKHDSHSDQMTVGVKVMLLMCVGGLRCDQLCLL